MTLPARIWKHPKTTTPTSSVTSNLANSTYFQLRTHMNPLWLSILPKMLSTCSRTSRSTWAASSGFLNTPRSLTPKNSTKQTSIRKLSYCLIRTLFYYRNWKLWKKRSYRRYITSSILKAVKSKCPSWSTRASRSWPIRTWRQNTEA